MRRDLLDPRKGAAVSAIELDAEKDDVTKVLTNFFGLPFFPTPQPFFSNLLYPNVHMV